MEPEPRTQEPEGGALESTTLDEYFDDFFAGTTQMGPSLSAPSMWLSLPPLPSESSVPTTPAAPSLHLVPQPVQVTKSVPTRLLPLPSMSMPLVLPPSRAPQTPPYPRLLRASPITPALQASGVGGVDCSQRPLSAPCTPANNPLHSPVTPAAAATISISISDERFAPSSSLASAICTRKLCDDSFPLFEALKAEIHKFVERLKCNVRDTLREDFDGLKGTLSPKQRTRLRSRRGAAVSRFKVNRTILTLEEATSWCVAHMGCPINTVTPRSRTLANPPCSPPAPIPMLPAQLNVQSPRTQVANTLASMSLRTPPAGMHIVSTPYTPPVMSLPPAKSMCSPSNDDVLLSSVTKAPINRDFNGVEFRMSAGLQTALLCRQCVTEVDALMERVRAELKQFVEEKKGLVREEYKTRLNEMKEKLTPKSRMRGRSRRGAAVTRYKNTATIEAWEEALRWFVENIHASEQSPQPSAASGASTDVKQEVSTV